MTFNYDIRESERVRVKKGCEETKNEKFVNISSRKCKLFDGREIEGGEKERKRFLFLWLNNEGV